MIKTLFKFLGSMLALTLASAVAAAEQPRITSISPGGELVWTNPVSGLISVVERSTTLLPGSWVPDIYDWGTNGWKTNRLLSGSAAAAFYRAGVITNPPDSNLVMHLSFDDDFPAGTVLDVSAHGNHGRRYGRPGYPTNWPTMIAGPDGSRAAEFHSYFDGYGLYGRSGDYIGIPITTNLTPLPQATIALWAHYYTSPGNNIQVDHTSTLMNSGKDIPGTFFLGRNYANYTSFIVVNGPNTAQEPIVFPDVSPIGNSGGWHHYVITFDGGVVKGYFDGALIGTGNVAATALTAAGHYIGMACWTFNVTPNLDLSVDGHPNNAWVNGAIDDVRLYNRVLAGAEIYNLYRNFDKSAPSVPTNLVATTVSSSQVMLRWARATDNFANSNALHYIVRRNGTPINTNIFTSFLDRDLPESSTNTYTIQSLDFADNVSAESLEASAVTFQQDGGVDLILDDSDGDLMVDIVGGWRNLSGWPGFIGQRSLFDRKDMKGWSITYRPVLPESGIYSVYLRYPGLASETWQVSSAVPVDVVSVTGTNLVTVNQRLGYGTWRLLGSFPFDAGTNGWVRIRTQGTDGFFVLGDAVRFVK